MSFNGRSSANVCVVLLHPLCTTSQSKYLHSDPGGCHCLYCLGAVWKLQNASYLSHDWHIMLWERLGPQCPCCFDWPPSSETRCSFQTFYVFRRPKIIESKLLLCKMVQAFVSCTLYQWFVHTWSCMISLGFQLFFLLLHFPLEWQGGLLGPCLPRISEI